MKIRYKSLIIAVLVIMPFCFFSMASTKQEETDGIIEEPINNTSSLENVSSIVFVKRMGLGWNLGNTMEACGDWIDKSKLSNYETAWGNPMTTKAMIDKVKEAGFSSVRIPVAWSNLMDEETFTIHPGLFKRVKQIVDWVIENEMIAVVNIHWDGGWWHQFPKDYDSTMKRFVRMWDQIAHVFKDYPANLVFEDLNEEGCFGEIWNQWGGTNHTPSKKEKAFNILNNINQTFVDLVRKSGGMNVKRHLLVAGYCTDVDLTASPEFKMPEDPENHLILSIHYYTPYTFAGLTKDESWGKMRRTWGTQADFNELNSKMQILKTRFLDNGVPIIIGEYGATTKNKEHESVRRFLLSVAGKMYAMGMCPMLWDTGDFLDRRALRFKDQELLKGFQEILRKKRD